MQDIAIQPLVVTFEDMSYIVEMPTKMKSQSLDSNKVQLLQNISGAFWPRVLIALIGVNGVG